MLIGEIVERYSKENSISHYEFAEKAGMTTVSLSRMIRENRLPAVPHIKNIARVMDMPFMDLIHEHYSTYDEPEGEK